MNEHVDATRLGRMRWLSLTAVVAVIGALAVASFGPAAQAQDDEETPLIKAMSDLNTEYKAVRRAARSGSYDEATVASVDKMQKAALTAKGFVPPMAAKVPADKRDAFNKGYRKVMAKLVMQLAQIEVALLEGRDEDATKGITELALIKKDGHDNYIEE